MFYLLCINLNEKINYIYAPNSSQGIYGQRVVIVRSLLLVSHCGVAKILVVIWLSFALLFRPMMGKKSLIWSYRNVGYQYIKIEKVANRKRETPLMKLLILDQLVHHGKVSWGAVNCKCSFEEILKNLAKFTKQILQWSKFLTLFLT